MLQINQNGILKKCSSNLLAGRKKEHKKKKTENKMKMADLSPNISIITVSGDGLKTPIKR